MTGKRATLRPALFLILFAVVVICAVLYGRREKEYSSERFLMDTLITIRAYGSDEQKLIKDVNDAFAAMQRIADLTDRFPPKGSPAFDLSEVCRINDRAGIAPVHVDRDVVEMLLLAKRFDRLAHGAIDLTIGPEMDLWGFAGDHPAVPPATQVAETLRLVDSSSLIVNDKDQTAFLVKRGMKLDLGGVAKGYATEKAARLLEDRGVRKALIDAGGNIRVIGGNRDDVPWRIGIKDPRKSGGIIAVIPLENSSAVTSGDYYRYFEAGGIRYNHILDPRTGYPASSNMSVTVITKNAGIADILSTALFVLKAEESLKLAQMLDGVDVVIVTSDRRILHTPSLAGKIEVKEGEGYSYDQGR